MGYYNYLIKLSTLLGSFHHRILKLLQPPKNIIKTITNDSGLMTRNCIIKIRLQQLVAE